MRNFTRLAYRMAGGPVVLAMLGLSAGVLHADDDPPSTRVRAEVTMPAPAGDADLWWEKYGHLWRASEMAEPLEGIRDESEAARKFASDRVELLAWLERFRRRYREKGLAFWEKFPADPRRYDWLVNTTMLGPEYWLDVDQGARMEASGTPERAGVDAAAVARWNARYAILRAQFMQSPLVSADQESRLRTGEFNSRIDDANRRLRGGQEAALPRLLNEFLDFTASHFASRVGDFTLQALAHRLLEVAEIKDEHGFHQAMLEAMQLSAAAPVRQLAAGRARVFSLRHEPLVLKLPTLQGGTIDLSQLRGKVVLIDIWSNSCAACIDAMPKIRAAYDRYRESGLEIVGIWQSSDTQREGPTALKITQRQGANWPMGIMTGVQLTSFRETYAQIHVPVTWLLDRRGRLLATNLSGAALEESIVRALLDPAS